MNLIANIYFQPIPDDDEYLNPRTLGSSEGKWTQFNKYYKNRR